MTWLKVDDKLHGHPKFVGCSLTAHGVWLIAASYSADHRTDGFVPTGVVRNRAGAGLKAAKELVAAGLFHEVEGGWMIHDFLVNNPSRAELERRSKANAENGSKGGRARAAKTKRSGSESLSENRGDGVANPSPRSRTSGATLGLVPAPGADPVAERMAHAYVEGSGLPLKSVDQVEGEPHA